MILTVLFASLLLLCISLGIASSIASHKRYYYLRHDSADEKKYKFWDSVSDALPELFDNSNWVSVIVTVLLITSAFGTVICGTASVAVAIKDVYQYETLVAEKEMLEYRLSTCPDSGNELLYHDILTFNTNLRHEKLVRDNPWISWFAGRRVSSIPLIDYKLRKGY